MNLLRSLSAKEYTSGVVLAERLGVSRTTISNRIAFWRERGVAIDIIPGKGYRLSNDIRFYDAGAIENGLSQACKQQFSLVMHDVIDSTNDSVAKHLARVGKVAIDVAEYQESGRGRRGRRWQSSPGAGIIASIGCVMPTGLSALQGLSLAVGVAIVEALVSHGFRDLALKWPNDIVTSKGKVGGVLIELSGEIDGPCEVVVGIGLNWHLPEAEVGYPVDALEQIGYEVSTLNRDEVTVSILAAVLDLMSQFPQKGFEFWRERWMHLDFYRNQEVVLMGYQSPVVGYARGVDASGALLLERKEGIEPFSGGELSMRPVS